MNRRLWAGTGAAAVLAALAVSPPAVGSAGPAVPELSASQATVVTLVTGDRVRVGPTTDGGRPALAVIPAQRRSPVPFDVVARGRDWYVLPGDAAPLVRSGQLDRELFNVTGLLRAGLDDSRAGAIPLIVRYGDRLAAGRAPVPAGAALTRSLPALGMAAVRERKDEASRFWAGAAGARPRTLGAGLSRVWLDQRVHASLDATVPQIHAPAAWNAGLTGRGVTVAVLDTGIDTDHPDLADAVVASRDFSGTGTVEDGFGHGTHVASIITGSAAASSGRYLGVAPDAVLAVGKVLDDTGTGSYDTVLAGMQWAATEVHAKVVNLSLGAGPTDGTDPMSVGINELTRQTGTLFVVAAGNRGDSETVSTPAVADEALAVASVDKSDQLSWFSSRGPRLGDGAVKPEIAAPGQEVVAARPPDVEPLGDPVGEYYQSLSGTSMATPHVAGSAALLAQQHPDWTAAQLKPALMATAAPLDDPNPFDAGTGRLDVARLVSQQVTASPGSASFFLPWPNLGASQERVLTYRNGGDAAVELDLSVPLTGERGGPAPADRMAVSPQHLTIPGGGQAQVTLAVTGQPGQEGHFQGILTARSADGGTVLRTAVGVYQEPRRFNLTVDLLDHDGQPLPDGYAGVTIFGLDSGEWWWARAGETLRLPEGRYAVHGTTDTERPGQEPEYTMISHPELDLAQDTALLLDGRVGRPVTASVADRPALTGGSQLVSRMSVISGVPFPYTDMMAVDPRFSPVYLATVPGTSSDSFIAAQQRRAEEPDLVLTSLSPQRFDVQASWLEPPATALNARQLHAVYGGAGLPEDLDRVRVSGSLVVLQLQGDLPWETVLARVDRVALAGGRAVLVQWVYPDEPPVPKQGPAEGLQARLSLPTMEVYSESGVRFIEQVQRADTTVSLIGRPYADSRYELLQEAHRQVGELRYQPRTSALVPVDTSYYHNLPDSVRLVTAGAWVAGQQVGIWDLSRAAAPGRRTEYFTAGRWDLTTIGEIGWPDYLEDYAVDIAAGQPPMAWNKAVAGPGTVSSGWASRQGSKLVLAAPLFSDAAGRPRPADPWLTPPDVGSISLYYNGELASRSEDLAAAEFDVPEEPATLGLDARVTRQASRWSLSTTVRAQWTFRSAGTEQETPLPLLTVRLDPALDLQNRAHAGRFSFPAYVARQDGPATVTNLTVEVSYDAGASWSPATVTRAGDHWTVEVNQPAQRYASLRATAVDSDGNEVVQTVIRAYQIQ